MDLTFLPCGPVDTAGWRVSFKPRAQRGRSGDFLFVESATNKRLASFSALRHYLHPAEDGSPGQAGSGAAKSGSLPAASKAGAKGASAAPDPKAPKSAATQQEVRADTCQTTARAVLGGAAFRNAPLAQARQSPPGPNTVCVHHRPSGDAR